MILHLIIWHFDNFVIWGIVLEVKSDAYFENGGENYRDKGDEGWIYSYKEKQRQPDSINI